MKTAEIEVLVMHHFDFVRNIIVPGVHWGIKRWPEVGVLHECDVLVLSKSNYATEVEIKISKSDLLKDKEKPHGHKSNFIKHLYFAVPKKLEELALQEIPERAGLLVVETQVDYKGRTYQYLRQVKHPTPNLKAVKWTDEEKMALMRLGCLRIMNLKKKLNKTINQ